MTAPFNKIEQNLLPPSIMQTEIENTAWGDVNFARQSTDALRA